MRQNADIVVLCWDKVLSNVNNITASLSGLDCRKTVIHATSSMPQQVEGWDWRVVDANHYYSQQFEAALQVAREDVLIIIVGDISHQNWEEAVARCIARFKSDDRIGVWGATDPTSLWERPSVHVESLGNGLDVVAQTDCSMWAMSRPVYERLKAADYSMNKYGWGIDWLAICHAYSTGRIAVRDRGVVVDHPAGTGYNEKEALRHMLDFIKQMTDLERLQYKILTKYVLPIMPWGERHGATE